MTKKENRRQQMLRGVILYTWDDFNEDSLYLAEKIRESGILPELDSVYGIPLGGLALAQRLGYLLNLRAVDKSEISERTLLVDDIGDSGRTFQECLEKYPIRHTAALFYNMISCVRPEFFVCLKWISFPWSREEFEKSLSELIGEEA